MDISETAGLMLVLQTTRTPSRPRTVTSSSSSPRSRGTASTSARGCCKAGTSSGASLLPASRFAALLLALDPAGKKEGPCALELTFLTRARSFTGGYMEVRLSLPGEPDTQGLWPGVWTLGNLGRAGTLTSSRSLPPPLDDGSLTPRPTQATAARPRASGPTRTTRATSARCPTRRASSSSPRSSRPKPSRPNRL